MTKTKKLLILILLAVSLIFNIFQLFQKEEYESKMDTANTEFSIALQTISIGIEFIENENRDKLLAIAMLSCGTAEASALYKYTSYYEENTDLDNVLWTLNNNITNNNTITEVLQKNDLSILIPVIKKLDRNPLDLKATEELRNLVIRYTSIHYIR
ncbi:hypothetical protein [Clostridium polynesiense]|uniref:hypothetical protein n=1 Tax=Clostridium polynesiense TaxID=1325933 RepID=UPI00058E8434|nr:hypothetical protein [Clostridium polynesiense]